MASKIKAVRTAVVIGFDNPADPVLDPIPHAERDAQAFSSVVAELGLASPQQTLLIGPRATRSAWSSKLRRLPRDLSAQDTLFVFYVGRAFSLEGENYLTCQDALVETGSRRIALFLDVHPAELPDVQPHLDEEELRDTLSPGVACFLSCRPGESSRGSDTLKGSIWTHHVLQALAGQAPLALAEDQLLTTTSLEHYLEEEVIRSLRRFGDGSTTQTPSFLGEDWVLADLSTLLAHRGRTADPGQQALSGGAFRAEVPGRIRDLAGFRKHHHLPDRVTPATQRFVAEVAAEDIRSDLDGYYSALREYMHYRRRDLEVTAASGEGRLRTPDFDYTIRILQAEEEPEEVVWQREIAHIRNAEVVLSPEFQTVFGGLFDTLAFDFEQPFDLESWVDRVEENLPAGVKLRCPSDLSSCEVTVPGFRGVIRLWPDRIEVQGPPTRNSAAPLVQTYLQFRGLFSDAEGARVGLLLGPGSEESGEGR
jgi:hypothetical protein